MGQKTRARRTRRRHKQKTPFKTKTADIGFVPDTSILYIHVQGTCISAVRSAPRWVASTPPHARIFLFFLREYFHQPRHILPGARCTQTLMHRNAETALSIVVLYFPTCGDYFMGVGSEVRPAVRASHRSSFCTVSLGVPTHGGFYHIRVYVNRSVTQEMSLWVGPETVKTRQLVPVFLSTKTTKKTKPFPECPPFSVALSRVIDCTHTAAGALPHTAPFGTRTPGL